MRRDVLAVKSFCESHHSVNQIRSFSPSWRLRGKKLIVSYLKYATAQRVQDIGKKQCLKTHLQFNAKASTLSVVKWPDRSPRTECNLPFIAVNGPAAAIPSAALTPSGLLAPNSPSFAPSLAPALSAIYPASALAPAVRPSTIGLHQQVDSAPPVFLQACRD